MKKRIVFAMLIAVGIVVPALSQKNVNSKFGKGINFMAEDSSMSMKLGLRFQTLFIAEAPAEKNATVERELMIRRYRLKFDGFAFSPRLIYKMELGISNRDNGQIIKEGNNAANLILDAVLKYELKKGLHLWFGQTKLPGNRERVISSQKLQFVDRSLVNSRYNLDRDLGVQLHHKFKIGNCIVKDKYAISMGEGRNITKADEGGFSYTGRVEFLPFGEFASKGDYFDADLKRESKPKLSFGVGYNYNDRTDRNRGQLGSFVKESRTLSTFFTDIMLKYKGWSLTSEFMSKEAVGESPILADSSNYFTTGSGFNLQTGYLFKNNFEVAARFTEVFPSLEIIDGGFANHTNQYTLGVSKYISEHNLKIQSDFSLTDTEGKDVFDLMYRFQIELAL